MQPIAGPPRAGVTGFWPLVEANAIAAHGVWNAIGQAPPHGGGGSSSGGTQQGAGTSQGGGPGQGGGTGGGGGGTPGAGMGGDGQGGGITGGQDSGPSSSSSGVPSGWAFNLNPMSPDALNAHRGTTPPANSLGEPGCQV